MSHPLELYRHWRSMMDLRRAYQDAKTQLSLRARGHQGVVGLVDADGCRWKVTVGYGPQPVVNVQAIAHLDDVKGPPSVLD